MDRWWLTYKKKPKFFGNCESISDDVIVYEVDLAGSYWDKVKYIIGYIGHTYKHVNDVAITFKTGTRINILEPKNLHEGASATYKEIFKKKYGNHVERKYSLEENTFKSFFLIIG